MSQKVTAPFTVSDESPESTEAAVMLTLQDGINDPQGSIVNREPLTGKPLSVTFILPDSANQTACDKINASPGFAKCGPLLPQEFFVLKLEGLTMATPILKANVQAVIFRMRSPDTLVPGTAEAIMTGDGATNSTSALPVTNLAPTINTIASLLIESQDLSSAGFSSLTIPLNGIIITHDGGQTLTVPKTNPIVLVATTGALQSLVAAFIDGDGNMYLNTEIKNGVSTVPSRFYADSVAAGIAF